jgi:riboflavin synthase
MPTASPPSSSATTCPTWRGSRLSTVRELARFIAVKGSVTLDGVSLTVNTVDDVVFSVLIIPHTLAVTTLQGWRAGSEVNIEVDLMARYAARLSEMK